MLYSQCRHKVNTIDIMTTKNNAPISFRLSDDEIELLGQHQDEGEKSLNLTAKRFLLRALGINPKRFTTVDNIDTNQIKELIDQSVQEAVSKFTIVDTVNRDEFALFKEEINSLLEPLRFGLETIKLELESAIASSVNTETVLEAIAIPEIRHNQLDLTEIPLDNPIPVQVTSEHSYPVGSKLYLEGLGEHLGFHHTMYTKYARDLGQEPDEYINQKAIAKGEFWGRGKEGKRAVFTRVE